MILKEQIGKITIDMIEKITNGLGIDPALLLINRHKQYVIAYFLCKSNVKLLVKIQKLPIFFGLIAIFLNTNNFGGKNTNNFSGKLLTLIFKEGRIKTMIDKIFKVLKTFSL